MSKGPSWTHSLVGEGEMESNVKETKQAVMKHRRRKPVLGRTQKVLGGPVWLALARGPWRQDGERTECHRKSRAILSGQEASLVRVCKRSLRRSLRRRAGSKMVGVVIVSKT